MNPRAILWVLLLLSVQCQDAGTKESVVTFTNVALGKKTQSSETDHGGVPARAVDGNTDGNWNSGSCTHSASNWYNYWQVDLGKVYNIAHINVYGRTDCCYDRLEGAKLWIGNSLCDTRLRNMGRSGPDVIRCDNSMGRIIKIENVDTTTLCEVQVMVATQGELDSYPIDATAVPGLHQGEVKKVENAEGKTQEFVNVAQHKLAESSSSHHGGRPSAAVDGFALQNWGDRSCVYIHNNGENWLTIDLGRAYKVDHITIYGRSDGNDPTKNGAKVRVGKGLEDCGTLSGMETAPHMAVMQCQLSGRIVRIENFYEKLVLCEVMVFVKREDLPENADDIEPTLGVSHLGEIVGHFFNVAKGKTTTQSSTLHNGNSDKAVDGNTAQRWDQGSCTHTNRGGSQWWEVNLGRDYQIDHVEIFGRSDRDQWSIQGSRVSLGGHRCGTIHLKDDWTAVVRCSFEESAARTVRIESRPGEYQTIAEVRVMVAKLYHDNVPIPVKSHGELVVIKAPEYAFENLGCWKDTQDRAIQTLEGTDSMLDGDYRNRDNAKNKCASVAIKKGYSVIALQHGGWCASAADAEETYMKYGESAGCGGDGEGGAWANQVYKITELVETKQEEDEVFVNVALQKPAEQRETLHGGVASRAVDGWTNSYWNDGSCTFAGRSNEMLTVDLGQAYKVDRVRIWGRTIHDEHRTQGIEIWVGRTKCGNITTQMFLEQVNPYTIDCKDKPVGQKVHAVRLGDHLTICELQVLVAKENLVESVLEKPTSFPRMENVALRKPTIQSSTEHGGESSRAVDGGIGESMAHWHRGSCTHTSHNREEIKWWEVDLGQQFYIYHIRIMGRSDCCRHRLNNALIKFDENVVASLGYTHNQLIWDLDMMNAPARRIKVQHNSNNEPITICELQAIVDHEYTPVPDDQLDLTQANLASTGEATGSSEDDGHPASNGIDGDDNAYAYAGSCFSTGAQQGSAWWSLEMKDANYVSQVIVYPRLDDPTSARERIDGAEVYVNGGLCGRITFMENKRWYAIDCKGVTGKTVEIRKEAGFLQFCEVIVHQAKGE